MRLFEIRAGITLEAALRDACNPQLRARLDALAALGDTPADHQRRAAVVAALGQALDDGEAKARQVAALALGRMGERSAIQRLAELAARDPDPVARQGAVAALGALPDPRATEAVRRALRDPAADVRFQAVAAVAELDPPQTRTLLELALTDDDAEIRGSAAAALGDLQDPAAADLLAQVLGDGDPSVRLEAAVALARVGDTRGAATLGAMLSSRTFGQTAAKYLFQLPSSEAREQLDAYARRRLPDPLVALWVAGALVKLGDARHRERITRAAGARNPLVSGVAVEVLDVLEQIGEST